MRLVTGRQMASIDRRAMESGVPGFDLMERAGKGVFEVVRERLGAAGSARVTVVCGKGNNGGDGFVVSRHLLASGIPVRTFLVGRVGETAGDARAHLEGARRLGIEVREAGEPGGEAWTDLVSSLDTSDLVVDALLGTGLCGPARGTAGAAIEAVNRAGREVVSVDIPSGVESDTGRADGPAVRATVTVTFAIPRLGHFFFPGRSLSGTLRRADIGIPEAAIEAEGVEVRLTTRADAMRWLPRRRPDTHKGDCGRVLILAGSVGLTGAAALCASGALRSGAGLVTVGTPASLNDVLEVKLTEAMTVPLPEVRRFRCLSLRARGEIRRLAERADVVALGPGLGRHRETVALVRRLLGEIPAPLVLDADGLNALAGDPGSLEARAAPTILTPHPGEFSRLTGIAVPEILRNPIEHARRFSVSRGAVVILKGAPTVVAQPDGEVAVNPTGNPGMATGGSGDVLTGAISAWIGQGLEPGAAARLGVYLHGAAGDLVRETRGEIGPAAGDIAERLPAAIKMLADGGLRSVYFDEA